MIKFMMDLYLMWRAELYGICDSVMEFGVIWSPCDDRWALAIIKDMIRIVLSLTPLPSDKVIKNVCKCISKFWIDPGVDDGIVCCMGHGEPVTGEEDIFQVGKDLLPRVVGQGLQVKSE